MYGKYRISSDPENVSTETLHDVQRPLSAVVKHAIIVIVAHATEVGDPIDSTGKPKEYPKTLEECVRMQLDLLEESLYSNVERPLIVSLSVPAISLYVIDDALIVLAVNTPVNVDVDVISKFCPFVNPSVA